MLHHHELFEGIAEIFRLHLLFFNLAAAPDLYGIIHSNELHVLIDFCHTQVALGNQKTPVTIEGQQFHFRHKLAEGNAYANTGDVDKAISTLKKAADMANSEAPDGINTSIAPTFLIQAARLLESQNKNDEALKIYKSIKEKYINSAAAQDIDKYIERLENK